MNLALKDLFGSLKPGVVHAWLFDVEVSDITDSYFEKLLCKEEVARANRYHFALDRVRFVIRRGILRMLLSGYTGIDPVCISYEVNHYGKLSCPSNQYKFNVSHSQNRVAFSFTLEHDIGVDIEQERPLPDFLHMAEAYFSTNETNTLVSLNPPDRLNAFYHIWTQKEAVIKAQGEGFTMPTCEFSVSIVPHKQDKLVEIKGKNSSPWRVISYQPDPGWWEAICLQTDKPIEVLHFRPGLQEFFQTYNP